MGKAVVCERGVRTVPLVFPGVGDWPVSFSVAAGSTWKQRETWKRAEECGRRLDGALSWF